MVSEKVYVSLNQEEYKSSRSELLESQAKVVMLMKGVKALSKIRKEKKSALNGVNESFSSLIINLRKVRAYFPEANLPKEYVDKIKKLEKDVKPESDLDEVIELDMELMEIREKLRMLNG